MTLTAILLDDKVIVSAAIGALALVFKYIVTPSFAYVVDKARKTRDLIVKVEALLTDFKPNGGMSTWDKIDRIDKGLTSLFNKHSATLALIRTLASMDDKAVYTTNELGECDWVSDGWSRLTGISSSHAEGYGWLNAIHPDDREWLAVAWESAVNTERDFNESYMLIHDTTRQITNVRGRAAPIFDHKKNIVGWVGTLTPGLGA